MPRGIDRLDDSATEPTPRRRMRRRKKELLYIDPPVEPVVAPSSRYHARPAKAALKGLEIEYEPPYESAAMPIGQRSEHPEYDIGHALARPIEIEEQEEAAA